MSLASKKAIGGVGPPANTPGSTTNDDEKLLSSPKDFLDGITSSTKAITAATGTSQTFLRANFFPVKLGKATTIYQYRIEEVVKIPKPADSNAIAEPATLPRRMMRRLTFLLREEIRAVGIETTIASDHLTCLVTVNEPIRHNSLPGTWRVSYYDEDQAKGNQNLQQHDIRLSNPVVTDLEAFVKAVTKNSPATSSTASPVALAQLSSDVATGTDLLNLLFSHCPNSYTRRDVNQEPEVTFFGSNKFYLLDYSNSGMSPLPPSPMKDRESPHNPGGEFLHARPLKRRDRLQLIPALLDDRCAPFFNF